MISALKKYGVQDETGSVRAAILAMLTREDDPKEAKLNSGLETMSD